MTVDPRALFPSFYDSPVIRAIAPACRWTVSGMLGDLTDGKEHGRKAPIDVRHLLAGCTPACRHIGELRGAFAIDETCLMTLDELTDALPTAANAAFYLQASTDGVIIIDIEPGCPEDVAASLLRLPGILYSELSMSGRGYHLVTSVPTTFHDFPIAAGKRVLRHERGWYEILLDHWVTFTRTPIPARLLTQESPSPSGPTTVEDLYASLAEKAVRTSSAGASAVSTGEQMPPIAYATEIVEQTLDSAADRLRTLEDFDGDHSRWEFSVLATLYRDLSLITDAALVDYSPSDQAWLLFRAAQHVIPPRPKHEQMRNGRPFLLDRAAALIAQREADRRRAFDEAYDAASLRSS